MNHIQCPLFWPAPQFCAYLLEHWILCVDKALQVIRIIHSVALPLPASSVVECRLSDGFFPMGTIKEKEHVALHIPTPRGNRGSSQRIFRSQAGHKANSQAHSVYVAGEE